MTASLRRDLRRRLPRTYQQTVSDLDKKLATCGEHLLVKGLPKRCPYTLDQILGDWWPEDPMRPRQHGPDDDGPARSLEP